MPNDASIFDSIPAGDPVGIKPTGTTTDDKPFPKWGIVLIIVGAVGVLGLCWYMTKKKR